MKVTAALAWWNEKPEDLAACVRSLGDIADRVVAIDGAYQRYPGATAQSDPAQADAIVRAAMDVGIKPWIITPKRLWRGEPEKRTRLMREAAKGSDWVAVVDADMIVHADREAVRATLASNPDVDVYTVDVRTLPGPSAATQWHEKLPDQVLPFIHLFRVYPDMQVERFHWWYSAVKDGSRFWYEYGGNSYAVPDGRQVCEAVHLDGYWMEHSVLLRDEARMLASRGYYNDRTLVVRLTGQEDALPGLPEPVWDYECRDINETSVVAS
jgi:hypothetical protein